MPGVYMIFDQNELIYIGMAKSNLYGRLNQHASGRRSGDQFCVYVFDRLVLPQLTSDEIEAATAGELLLDPMVKEYVRTRLSYKFLEVADGQTARDLEGHGLRIVQGEGASLLNAVVK